MDRTVNIFHWHRFKRISWDPDQGVSTQQCRCGQTRKVKALEVYDGDDGR